MKLNASERVRKPSRTGAPLGVRFRSAATRCALIITAASLVLIAIFFLVSAPKRYQLTVGSISRYTITAARDVVDEITTTTRRDAAAAAVEPTYHLREGASDETMGNLTAVFDELRNVQQYGLTLRREGDTPDTIRYRSFSDSEIEYGQGLVSALTLSRYQVTTLLRTETEDFNTMVSTLNTAVENALNTSIREGQVSQAIDSIRQISGYRVPLTLMQNLVPTILRNTIQPNMVIDTEQTEEARKKARDSVEPVIYLQGQNIVREGEIVQKNQIAMLTSLGMLENTSLDIRVYLGAVLLVIASMLAYLLLQHMLDKEILRCPRKMTVSMLSIVISVGLSAVFGKVLNVYAMPSVMTAMLLTSLLGWRVSLPASVATALLVSGIAAGSSGTTVTEVAHILCCTLVASSCAVAYLRYRPQRMRIFVCAVIALAADAIVLPAILMMTSSDLSAIQNAMIYRGVGNIMASMLSLGLQPVFETVFNLATPSKLLELANPNQPLLRRLQLEAPGTYHHAIIVANLAEAAADKIGANALLARTGAYYHDVGKLKRPLYFKENQMGDNPHDNTDPYVSAAVVTAHTRDGLHLAQKYHLPVEIQDIIVEHHGNTPVMYFYHKATQLAGDKPVDINDFRYDGRRPTTRESAIVMMADTIEAAVRSMPDPTPDAIAAFIKKLVKGKLDDDQLSNSPLTLKDIELACEAFSTVLNGAFHERIEYPNVEIPHNNTEAVAPAETTADAKEEAGK